MEESPAAQNSALIKTLLRKGSLKQDIYKVTFDSFQQVRIEARQIIEENRTTVNQGDKRIAFEYQLKNDFGTEITFGSDVLIFLMHSNIFEFSRDHEVMKTPYVKEDPSRSYCGMITIFNFLSDSFRYNRLNDIGYMIGRVFINKDKHYFIEGKKEIGQLYNNFSTSILDLAAIRQIVESAMLYTINFDLLTPPFDNMKEVSLGEMQVALDSMPMKTGKRLGFKFQADTDEMK
ncbi:MAG: hypothetical protein NTU44_12200 [Bacteroidetes bacterium]|nr:hypothetical protein [Bacteroidota bacterium]